MKQVALIGGSFDPIHQGHVQIATFARDHLRMDEVWLIPAYQAPLKDRVLTSDQDRLKMCQLAIEGQDQFRIETIELDAQKKCYTVDTLKALKEKYPDVEFTWLIGNDQLDQFDKWKEPETLLTLAHFVCVDRDGKMSPTIYDIQQVHMPMVPVSSSEIRKGNQLNYVDPKVLAYIYEHRLYIHNFLQNRLYEKRIQHSLSVAKLCEEIAISHQLDGQKAYLIGLFHDIAKAMPKEELRKWMEAICPENLHWPTPVWHGFVGAAILHRIFQIEDQIILEAVYHHVLGSSEDPYAMIVFCADKLDPLRDYDSQKEIDLCKRDLTLGFQEVHRQQKAYLAKEGQQNG